MSKKKTETRKRLKLEHGTEEEWDKLIKLAKGDGVGSILSKLEGEKPVDEKVLNFIKNNKRYSIERISDKLDVGVSKVRNAIELLNKKGYNIIIGSDEVELSTNIKKAEPIVYELKPTKNNTYKFGAVGDNHLGSRYERLDVLKSLYQRFKEEGITTVYNTGNWIDGEARFNKHDLHTHGFDNQINYMIENYPQIKGIETHYVSGDDHEGWYTQRFGIDTGRRLQQDAREAGRTDLVYLGHMEQDVILKHENGEIVIRVLHPGGGSSYALSYSVQKIVESYQEHEKPDILLVGHYHKAEYSYVRGVHVIQTGCTQDQTPFMRKKKLAAHLGGWIFEFSLDENAKIFRFKTELMPFYNSRYYQRKWEYQW